MSSAFKAYDIRGVYNQDFDKDTVYKVGFFLGRLMNTREVAVGRDVRVSSPEIHDALIKGITDSGIDAWDLGLCTTPMVYFATVHLNAGASVQITASHNPKQYNGLKISRAKAIPVGVDSGLVELENMVNTLPVVPASVKGKVFQKNVKDDYIAFLKGFLPDLSGLKIAMDCSNGMSSILVHEVFGDKPSYIYDTLDGTFPNHEPNPLVEENSKDLSALVLKTKSDVGVMYDGDADRVIFIDDKGRFLQPDYVTAVIGSYFLAKEKGKVLVDIRTSRSTTEYLQKKGASEVIIWKVGHSFAKAKIREEKCIFGGELAGHYYFRDFFNCDSGMLASLIVLQSICKIKKEGRTFSSLMDEIIKYPNSGETNFKLDRKDEAMDDIATTYRSRKPDRILDFDGYRMDWPTWWFSVRKSNTEPYLRLICEASTKEELDRHMNDLTAIIKSYM